MTKIEITKEDIEKILNKNLGVKYWELELGIGLQYEYQEGDIKFSAPYPEMGKELWKAFKSELYEVICDREQKNPQKWLEELISGDIRNLIVGITSAITSKYEISLGIVIPVAALILKTNILFYCSVAPKKNIRSVLEILSEKKPKKK